MSASERPAPSDGGAAQPGSGGPAGARPGQGSAEAVARWQAVDHGELARREGAARAAAAAPALARLAELVGVVHRLRDDDGCPWDRKQTLESMARHLLEEAGEAVDAVADGSLPQVAEELGDVLMNVLLMARIAEQQGHFDLGAVAAGIAEKLVRRHPHVFGEVDARDVDAALASWNASKAREGKGGRPSALDGVARGLPALVAALETGEKAARTGFDWPGAGGALAKLREELAELEEALRLAGVPEDGEVAEPGAAVTHELGDVLFAAAQLGRKLGLDPELVLRQATARFRERFIALEQDLGEALSRTPLAELERRWRSLRRDGPAAP